MQTIVIISDRAHWASAQESGQYTYSTLDSRLKDVGFIHCTTPDQTIETVNRHFTDRNDILLLLIDTGKVRSEVKFEKAISGRAGVFPHIYGPLNVDAVYDTASLHKGTSGQFMTPANWFKPAGTSL